MSYKVFALKWRPKDFDEIIGQNHIVTTLKQSLEKNRLAHAYLFSGPRGVGKTSTARILAKALNCQHGPTTKPCQKCSSCIGIAQGSNFDVIEIDGASNRQIDDIRALRESVKFAPTTGKFKVYIIDEVHMLTTEAFNALLKTLEEPPEFVKFIFATTHPYKVPPTILSRCQRLDFRRVSVMEIIGQLEKIVKTEDIDVDKEVLVAVAKASDGSLRDAESILDQLISFSRDKISLKDVISVLGLVEQDVLFEITQRIIQKDAAAVLSLLNKVIDDGKDASVFLNNLIEHFRNLMVAKITQADQRLVDLPQDICQKLLEQSSKISLEEIFFSFNTLINAQETAKRMESLRIPLEIGLVKLAQDKKPPTQNAAAAVHKETHAVKGHPVSDVPAQHAERKHAQENKSTHPVIHKNIEDIHDAWENIINSLGKIKMSVATYLNEGNPLKVENNVLTIGFPKNYTLHKESLEGKENKAIIEKILSELFNTSFRVDFILTQQIVPASSEDDPFIKTAINTFNARTLQEG